MRRYQYRLNDQNVSLGPWGAVTPLKYIETVPGETYGGTFSVKLSSGLIDKVIHSRAYYDLYAFYCPLRLLWPDFPEHLVKAPGQTLRPPVTKNLWPENFETTWVGNEGEAIDAVHQNAAWLRRMYYMCGYSFFHPTPGGNRTMLGVDKIKGDILDGQYDNHRALVAASARSSTLETSVKFAQDGSGQKGRPMNTVDLLCLNSVMHIQPIDSKRSGIITVVVTRTFLKATASKQIGGSCRSPNA
jgi:hypothetical protein